MIRHGEAPYLECSTAGDKRFSAFCARLECYGGESIEAIYQGAKIIDGLAGRSIQYAKGKTASNQKELKKLYWTLWSKYLDENPELMDVLVEAKGLSDKFGQAGRNCQATVLWALRDAELVRRRLSLFELPDPLLKPAG